MVKKGITGGILNAIHQYMKAYNNYMKNCDENKESSYLNSNLGEMGVISITPHLPPYVGFPLITQKQ